MHWRVAPDYRGAVVAIVGGGSSLSLSQVRLLGIARASDLIKVISLNDAIYPCWFADLGFSCDREWWQYHGELAGFPGRRVSLDDSGVAGVDFLKNTGSVGFDEDPGNLRSGGNSGYQALHLCAHLMPAKILLVGFDMRGAHWFGEHPPALRRTVPHMDNRIRRFDDLKAPLAERGIEVVNCTPGSALGAWRRGDLETELSAGGLKMDKKPQPVKRPPVPQRQGVVPANRAITTFVKR